MALSNFLNDVAKRYGAEALEGSIVFVKLDREVDEFISRAFAFGPYHPGNPSPWSHCFLLAEPFRGPSTKILDCTIRDTSGRVLWDANLKEALASLGEESGGSGAARIHEGSVSDYDDTRVSSLGVRWLPGLAADERAKLVEHATALKAANVRYDLPASVREMVQLLLGIRASSATNRLFASAFVQSTYRSALGNVGDFALDTSDEDTTPDDIWYSHKGLGIANTPDTDAAKKAHAPEVQALFGSKRLAESAKLAAAPKLASLVPKDSTRGEIEKALKQLDGLDATTAASADTVALRTTLQNALAQLDRAASAAKLGQSDAVVHSDDLDLSLVQSAIAEPSAPTSTAALFGRDVRGHEQYEHGDVGWLRALWNRVTHLKKVRFPTAKQTKDVVYSIPDETTIAIAGDWGTGNDSSQAIAKQMAVFKPDYTIHLGDVYYSGTESEEHDRFVSLWPEGARGSFALNSNHEMYSGGRGYFGVALSNAKFRQQKGYSYFALTNSSWLIVGLDSAHGASGMYQNGDLNEEQRRWLRDLMQSDVASSKGAPKNVMILSHHQGMELDGERTQPLFSQVCDALGRAPHRWYWGHVHGVAAFEPVKIGDVDFRGRLVGHGGVPYAPDEKTAALEWTEDQLAGDKEIPERGRNGFAFLRFGVDELREQFVDEFGNVRWKAI